LWLGEGVHKALEAYYRRGSDPVKVFKAWARKGAAALTAEQYDELLELGTGMLRHYVLWSSFNDPLQSFKSLATETPFTVPLEGFNALFNGAKVVYSGRIDGLCTYRASASPRDVFIHEIKTMAQLADDNLTLAEQASFYMWAASHILKDYTVRGVVYTLIRKKVPAVPNANGKIIGNAVTDWLSLKELLPEVEKKWPERAGSLRTVIADLKDKEFSGMENPFVWRRVVTRNEHELREAEQRIHQLARMMLSEPVLYPTPDLVGCRLCGFREPCIAMSRGDNYEVLLKTLYQPAGQDRQYVPLLEPGP
jgi:hypothetical protein